MSDNPVGDARFYARSGPFSIEDVALAAHGSAASSGLMLTGVAPLQVAGPDEVSFLHDRRYAAALDENAGRRRPGASRHGRPGACDIRADPGACHL